MYPRYFNGNCPSTLLTVAINNVTICGDAEPRRTYLEALPRQTNGDGTSCFVPLLIREADAPHKSWWIAWKCSINICQFKGFKNPPTPFKMDKEGLSFFPPPHLYISSHELIHSMLFSKYFRSCHANGEYLERLGRGAGMEHLLNNAKRKEKLIPYNS